jgi:tetratricopeptide (TPR) repeat protein
VKGALALVLLAACRAATGGPYEPSVSAQRDTARAQELNARAADALEGNHAEAERLLREALTADLFFGPAHNNLGVLYLKQGKLYEAAGEFEWARKLLPGHPDPRMNLALTLEQAGKTDEAIATYQTALEVWPGHIQTIQALARLNVVAGQRSPELEGWLAEIELRGESEAWRKWAHREQLKRRRALTERGASCSTAEDQGANPASSAHERTMAFFITAA